MKKTYKKYDDQIKEMVIKTGNPNSFADLKIPRSTALYWIRQSKKRIKVSNLDLDSALKLKIKKIEKELEIERSKNLFLSEILKNLKGLHDLYNKKNNKSHIIKTFSKYNKWISTEKLCRSINLNSSKFYRFKIDILGCQKLVSKNVEDYRPIN
eukprot:GHVO01060982.1.p1 GENE.GHVO01060982.1~~GHVO01060982.1.p1  ORF type:complete len:154 (+),score=0.26 GHVO01060982.1:66-527(+)